MAPDPTGCARRDLFPQIHQGLHADGPRMPVPRRLRGRLVRPGRSRPASSAQAPRLGASSPIGVSTLRQPASGRAPGLAAAECRGRPRGGLRRHRPDLGPLTARGSPAHTPLGSPGISARAPVPLAGQPPETDDARTGMHNVAQGRLTSFGAKAPVDGPTDAMKRWQATRSGLALRV